jgi:WD repeat-containing protein 89
MNVALIYTIQFDLENDFDIREPSLHTQDQIWVTDYFIGCHTSIDGNLPVFVGSNEGDVALLKNVEYDKRDSPWALERLFVGAHVGVVRSVLWDELVRVLRLVLVS